MYKSSMRVLIAKFPEHNSACEFTDKSGAHHHKATRSVATTERSELSNQLGGVWGHCNPLHGEPWTKLQKVLSFSIF